MFVYRLAAHCREWDVFGLLAALSPEQVDEWLAFDEIEPLGLEKLYGMLALHGALLAGTQGIEISPDRFYPQRAGDGGDDGGEPMSDGEFAAAFQRLAQ